MKKTFLFTAVAVMLVGSVAFAKESTLIDFTLLDADCCADSNGNATQNSRTVMDYSVAAGATFNEDQKNLMKTSLSLPEWEVVLNASARSVTALANSQVVAAPVKSEAKVPFAGKNVMGVRVVFPEMPSNASARVVPAFDIPAYEPLASADENGVRQEPTDEEKSSGKTLFEDGYGVVKNVGTLKQIAVTTMGMNFPHGLYVILKDTDNVERRYFMGYLNFDGWKTLIWSNPDYISEIRTREISIYPVYPRGTPFVKFVGFQITRDAADQGGDYIGYFKDVKIIYDEAVRSTERDIVDEDIWGIISTKENKRQAAEMERFGDKQVNRYLEREKMATEDPYTAVSYMDDGDSSSSSSEASAQ